jgi:catechol 2,3-dioxygenase-like lactoylglutathione lyase family enzyme
MNVLGFDRVEMLVRDMNRAVQFFSSKLGLRFEELDEAISRRDGLRVMVSHDAQLHLFTPLRPLAENAPPALRKLAELSEAQELLVLGLAFRVEDVERAGVELAKNGIRVQDRLPENHDYVSMGMDDFAQIIASPEDTLGLMMIFAKYRRVTGHANR